MTRTLHFIRLALRRLRRHPLGNAVLVLSLALGIGATSAIYSALDATLLRPLPFPQPDRVVAVWEGRSGEEVKIQVADGNFPELRDGSDTLAHVGAYVPDTTLVSAGTRTFRTSLAAVTAGFFDVLGVEPVLGRLPTAGEHGEGTPAVAVIGHGFWRSAFAGDRDVIGRSLRVYGEETTVVGVLPAGQGFPHGATLWVDMERHMGTSRTAHNLHAVARLAPGVELEQAREELAALATRLAATHAGVVSQDLRFVVLPLHDELAGVAPRNLGLIFLVVAIVLLIACGNIAGILLVRTYTRRRELAVRRALGADGGELMAQLLTESATLGLVGGLLGLVVAAAGVTLLEGLVPAALMPDGSLVLNLRVVAFTLVLGLSTGLLCGLVPAWWLTRRAPSPDLGGTRGTAEEGRGRRLGSFFVVPQYAFSLTAVVIAGLLVKSLVTMIQVDPGFAARGLVTAEVLLPTSPPSEYADDARLLAFHRELERQTASLPGVADVTYAAHLPLSGSAINGLVLREGETLADAGADSPYPDFRVVGQSYFRLLRIPLVRGRDFATTDDSGSLPVAVVNRRLAEQLWPGENPLGRRLVAPGLDFDQEMAQRALTVVGVAADVRHRGLQAPPAPALYVPASQHPDRASTLHLVASVEGEPARFLDPIRGVLADLDPGLPVGDVQPMESLVRSATAQPRFHARLLSAFAALALVLSLLGVYGVMSHSVAQRRREMAVRMALGARPHQVRRLVLGYGLRLVVAGQVLGVAAVWGVARFFEDMLFEVQPLDWTVLAATSLLLVGVTLGTCYLPARRAAGTDPLDTLRQE